MLCTFDTLDNGAELTIGDGTLEISRTGLVTEIPADAQSDPFVMVRAMEEIVAQAGQTHPALNNAFLSRLLIRAGRAGDSVTFAATYTTPTAQPQGGSTVRWLVEDDASLAQEIEEMDLSGHPIQTFYRADKHGNPYLPSPPPSGPSAAEKGSWLREANIVTHTGQAHVLRPRRALSIHGYITGRPSEDVLFSLGTVNSKTWMGLKPGYWFVTHVSAAVEGVGLLFDHRQSVTRVAARFESKLRRDWSHYFFHRNLAGKIPGDMSGDAYAAAVKQTINYPYNTIQDHFVRGFTRVGLYETSDLGSIYGF